MLETGSSDLNIENTNIKTAAGIELDEHQRTLVGSVLDVSQLQFLNSLAVVKRLILRNSFLPEDHL